MSEDGITNMQHKKRHTGLLGCLPFSFVGCLLVLIEMIIILWHFSQSPNYRICQLSFCPATWPRLDCGLDTCCRMLCCRRYGQTQYAHDNRTQHDANPTRPQLCVQMRRCSRRSATQLTPTHRHFGSRHLVHMIYYLPT